MSNIIALIPARGGSKSIPKKNIKELGGKPLIVYSIESALQAGLRTIVNTDSEEIAKIAKDHGAEVMLRPATLGEDNTSMYEVLKVEIPKISPVPDMVLLLQPTSPFRKKIHIKNSISYLTTNLEDFDSLIAVEKVPEKYNPAQMIISTPHGKGMIIGEDSKPSLAGVPIAARLTRRQDFPEAWIPTGSIYLFKTENLPKGSIYGDRVMLYESESSININNLADWEEAEKQI